MKTVNCLIVFLFILITCLFLFFTITQKAKYNDEYDVLFLEPFENPQKNVLVNLTDFHYIINNTICKTFNEEELLGVIIVTSYIGHDFLRSAHRQSISQEKLKNLGLVRVFLLAEIPTSENFISQDAVLNEQQRFGDLIQGNFIEAYKNLTYKHIMGLKWSADECKNAKYIIKIDDDSVYDIYNLQNYLIDLEINPNTRLLAGFILNNKKPIRIQVSKWYVPRKEFRFDVYPDYLSGWLYITNPKTAHDLVVESETTDFFWIDDTYVTGIIREKLSIKLVNLNKWFSANSEFLNCCIKDIKNYNFKCDYYVGPNGGENKMIIEYTKAIEKCYNDDCIDRTPDKLLSRTCVGTYKNIVKDHGKPIVEIFKL